MISVSYDDALSKLRQYEDMLWEYQRKKKAIDEKLERIRNVKSKIGTIKGKIETRSKKQATQAQSDDTYYEWSGDVKDDIYELYCTETGSAYKSYNLKVDDLHDAIVDLETEYEVKRSELLGLIGEVSGWWSTVSGEIEKWLN